MAGEGQGAQVHHVANGSLRIRRSEYQRWLASREEAA